MSLEKLKFAGLVVGEFKDLIVGVVANGSNYLKDLALLPSLVKDGMDASAAVKDYQATIDQLKTLDEAGRAELAAAWAPAFHYPADAAIDTVLEEGVVVVSYGLEALAFFLNTKAPAA